MGKSALALDIAKHATIIHDKAAAFFSMEMTKDNLALRLMCGQARMNSRDTEKGLINENGWENLSHAAAKLIASRIFVDSSAQLKPLQMRNKLRKLFAKNNVGLIVIDYMQMMEGDKRQENRQQDITYISRMLKGIAKDFDVPVLAVSQLNRAVEGRGGDRRPQLSDLRESGAIEQDADVVMFVYRPEYYMQDLDKEDPKLLAAKGKAEVIVAKQRNGPTGTVYLHFDREFATFSNLAKDFQYQQPYPVTGEQPF